jgi:hypothetical protein
MVDTETGELIERRLEHGNGEAKKFYEGGCTGCIARKGLATRIRRHGGSAGVAR